jgi:signal-transduction protein with cAMP-binding, CBS, and nucleotidyltransferase domain
MKGLLRFRGGHAMKKNTEKIQDKVTDFINAPTIQISAQMSVFEACKRMKKYKVGSILVSEGKHTVGIFTETDLLTKVVAKNEYPDDIPVFNVMSKELVFIDSEATMVAAFLKMQIRKIRHLVVKEKEKVVGVLSIKDVAKYYVHKFGGA